jgi:hypothetical protein
MAQKLDVALKVDASELIETQFTKEKRKLKNRRLCAIIEY